MALESLSASDFAARQAHKQRWSAALVFFFIVFFLLIGGAVDFLYFDAVSSTDFPMATVREEQSDETVSKTLPVRQAFKLRSARSL